MLMLDCGTSAIQLFNEVPGFQLQADFILSSKDSNEAKRLAFHSLLLNIGSQILVNYCKSQEEEQEGGEINAESAEDRKTLQ